MVSGRQLFRRAILLSGSALTTWAIARRSLHYAQEVATRLNCTAADPALFLPCLKQLPVEDVGRVRVQAPRYLSAFGPTIDGRAVLPSDVRHLMVRTSESVLSGTALMAGMARHEGLAFLRQTDVTGQVRRDRWRKSLRTFVQVSPLMFLKIFFRTLSAVLRYVQYFCPSCIVFDMARVSKLIAFEYHQWNGSTIVNNKHLNKAQLNYKNLFSWFTRTRWRLK